MKASADADERLARALAAQDLAAEEKQRREDARLARQLAQEQHTHHRRVVSPRRVEPVSKHEQERRDAAIAARLQAAERVRAGVSRSNGRDLLADSTLPTGWIQGYSKTYSRIYYINTRTGERSWKMPSVQQTKPTHSTTSSSTKSTSSSSSSASTNKLNNNNNNDINYDKRNTTNVAYSSGVRMATHRTINTNNNYSNMTPDDVAAANAHILSQFRVKNRHYHSRCGTGKHV